jgi:hypothetical protein
MLGIATAALAVGQAVTTHIGTNQAYSANKQAANYNYANDLTTLGQKRVELDQARSENAFDTAIATAREQGRIVASATDQGLAPTSITQQLNSAMFGIGRQAMAEDTNDQNARIQLAQERTGADIRRQSQINSKPRSSGVQLALGVGQGLLSGANTYKSAGGRK